MEYKSRGRILLELLSRVTRMEEVINRPYTKKHKIIVALDKLSGLYLDELTRRVVKIIESNLAAINVILSHYPIKTFDDYDKIKEPHLNDMVGVIKNMCTKIRSQTPAIFNYPFEKALH